MTKSFQQPDVIIYGGAFDPPHQGHVDCLTLARHHFPSAKLLVIPALSPAGAEGNHKHPDTSFDKRTKLCDLAFKQIENAEIDLIEASLPTPNYTVNTLEALLEKYKNIGFLIGQDQLDSFDRWNAPKSILALSSLVVVRRSYIESSKNADLKTTAEKMALRLGEKINWITSELGTIADSKIFIIDKPVNTAISTSIREMIVNGQHVPSDWLSPGVREYIRKNSLYGMKGHYA